MANVSVAKTNKHHSRERMVLSMSFILVHVGTYVSMYAVYPAGAKVNATMMMLRARNEAVFFIVVRLVTGLFLFGLSRSTRTGFRQRRQRWVS